MVPVRSDAADEDHVAGIIYADNEAELPAENVEDYAMMGKDRSAGIAGFHLVGIGPGQTCNIATPLVTTGACFKPGHCEQKEAAASYDAHSSTITN